MVASVRKTMRSSVPCSNRIDSFSLLDIQVVSLKRDYYLSLACQVDLGQVKVSWTDGAVTFESFVGVKVHGISHETSTLLAVSHGIPVHETPPTTALSLDYGPLPFNKPSPLSSRAKPRDLQFRGLLLEMF